MMKTLMLLYAITIGFCNATPNCHELQKSQLASLNERITQMLNSLYTSPLHPKPSTPPVSSSSNDTPSNDYASTPYESNYYNYPTFAVPPPQVIYVTSPHSPTMFAPTPAIYTPPPAIYAPPPTYAPQPPIALPIPTSPPMPPAIPAIPSIYAPAMPAPQPIAAPPTSSPFYHLESKEPYDPYRNAPTVPKSPWSHYYENYSYPPMQHPATNPMPYPPNYPVTYPYSSDYSSYPEYATPYQYPPKPVYSPPAPAYLPPQGYLPSVPMPYPPIYS